FHVLYFFILYLLSCRQPGGALVTSRRERAAGVHEVVPLQLLCSGCLDSIGPGGGFPGQAAPVSVDGCSWLGSSLRAPPRRHASAAVARWWWSPLLLPRALACFRRRASLGPADRRRG